MGIEIRSATADEKTAVSQQLNSFLTRLILFSLILGAADFCWNYFFPGFRIPHSAFILLFFTVVTYIFHAVMMKNKNQRPQVIVRSYMSGTVVRLFLFIIVLILYRIVSRPTLVPFAIAFIMHYFAFTFFEVSSLMKQFRNIQEDRKA